MSKRVWSALIALLAALTMLGQHFAPEEAGKNAHSGPVQTPPHLGVTGPAESAPAWPPAFPRTTTPESYVPLLPLTSMESASQSLGQSRLSGDPRAPALNPVIETRKPSSEELLDEKMYARFQQQQMRDVYQHFIAAADPEITQLRELLNSPQGQALSQYDQQKIQRKLSHILAMQQQLQQTVGSPNNAVPNTPLNDKHQ